MDLVPGCVTGFVLLSLLGNIVMRIGQKKKKKKKKENNILTERTLAQPVKIWTGKGFYGIHI